MIERYGSGKLSPLKASSEDLRERVLLAVDAGTPHAEIVRVLRVSLAKARTQEDLESAIAAALATLTSEDARSWFNHCGFPIAQST